jgi:hypothetical protein
MAKRKAVFDKRGIIPGESLWKDVDGLTDEELNIKLSVALNFYANNIDKKDIKKDLFVFLKEQKKLNRKEQAIVRANADEITFSAYKVARIANLGFPLNSGVGKSILSFIDEQTKRAIALGTPSDDNDTTKPAKPTLTPLERIEINVGETILTELEIMLDTWMEDTSKKGEPIDLANLVKTVGIPLQGYRYIHTWLDQYISEIHDALNGTDEYAVESYSHLRKPVLRSWNKSLLKMKDAVESLEGKQKEIKRKTRKKRVKKPANAFVARQRLKKKVDKVKYLVEFPELGLKSIGPESIIGAQVLYIYNTKMKKFGCVKAMNRDGLDLKGTSVTNFDEKVSFNVRLRKPEEFLKEFANSSTLKQVENIIDKVKTKRTHQTGRLNEHVIILKTFK